MNNRKIAAPVLCAVLLSVVAASCRDMESKVTTSTIVVASKDFSESELLAELIAQTVDEKTSLRVERRFPCGDTFRCFEAIQAGEIDVYPEYTGTMHAAIFRQPNIHQNAEEIRRSVSRLAEQQSLRWVSNFGFENTFAVFVRNEDAQKRRMTSVSDLITIAPTLHIGFGYEFAHREDGYHAFIDHYGLQFRDTRPMQLASVYAALRNPVAPNLLIDVAIGNSTDGEPLEKHLTQLSDDQRFFPAYQAGILARDEKLRQSPELDAALRLLENKFSVAVIQRANYRVQIKQESISVVARDLLRQQHIVD
jgi:osmoprotectant transport system substrate-binding protein